MVSFKSVVISGISYFIHPHKLGTITATINPDSIIPVTLLSTDEIFGGRLEQVLTDFDARDDVFIPDFGAVLVEKVPENETESTSDFDRSSLSQQVYSMISNPTVANSLEELPSGPYILYGPNLYQAWRMYADDRGAFTTGVYVENVTHPGPHRTLPFNEAPLQGASIAVPSRLYHTVTEERPFAGLRVSISDAFDLKGTWSTMSSRDYTSAMSPAATTARFVESLIELGAIIIGKTKVAPLGTGTQWVDTQEPWSPRADGYQATTGSGAGAAVGTASYGWLDKSVCEDAIAGLRASASHAGVYALRPTYSLTTLDGLQVNAENFSTVAVAARKLQDLETVQNKTDDPEAPAKIVHLTDLLTNLDDTQEEKFRGFVQMLEESLGLQAEEASLAKLWAKSPPREAQDAELKEYMSSASNVTFSRSYYLAYAPFLEDFTDEHGVEPFLEETTRRLIRQGEKISTQQFQEATERIQAFANWFHEQLFANGSSTLVVFPSMFADPQARTEQSFLLPDLEGISPQNLAPLLGAPQLIAPYGQTEVEYNFNGAQQKVWLPLSAAVVGPRESDNLIVRTIRGALEEAGWPTEVKTGRLAFDLKEGLATRSQKHQADSRMEL